MRVLLNRHPNFIVYLTKNQQFKEWYTHYTFKTIMSLSRYLDQDVFSILPACYLSANFTMHYYYAYNIDIMNRCNFKKEKPRHRITLALYGEVWSRFQTVLKERWEGSFNSWVEFAMTCYMQEICDDCPYVDDEDKGKGYKPAGIGKNSNE